MPTLVWKLLRQHISIGQLAGFFLANLFGRERITLPCKRTECADFLCSYDEILFHKAVSLGEYRNDIFIKLHTKQYNHHAE